MPTLTIHHTPYGLEHPYDPSPLERQPRQPVAGEVVTVGAQTSPAGMAQRVTLLVSLNDAATLLIPAEVVGDAQDVTSWRAQLPALQAGDHVRYCFQAETTGHDASETRTDRFEFTVAGWQSAQRVRSWERVANGLRLSLEAGLSVTITLDQPDQVRVRYAIHKEPSPAPATSPLSDLSDLSDPSAPLTLEGAGLRVVIQRDPYRLAILRTDGVPIWEDVLGGLRSLQHNDTCLRIAQSWRTPPTERFFGFGERFNRFDQRGQQIDTLVYEQYKNQDKRTYLPVPFLISSHGYALFLNTARRADFDLAASQPEAASFTVEDETLEWILFAGEPKKVLTAFTSLVGKPVLPPKWAFGLWMSSNEWNSQAQVMEQVALTTQHAIPATVLVIEAWSDEATFYLFNDAHYTPRPDDASFTLSDFTFPPEGRWPDPKGMVEALHQQGIHLILWQIPVFKKLDEPHPQHDLDVADALAKGLVIQEADGSSHHIRPVWFRGGYVPDFSNPALERWWFARRRYLIDELGVDGFKTDGGEHLWGDRLRSSEGEHSSDLLNRFPNLYQAAYARFAGPQRMLFSRAGYTGSQQYSTHWAGDENSTFAAFRHSITAGLTAGASGLAFWGWDIGGFGGAIPSAELYLRATAMATFCPIMQYHSEYNPERIECRDRTPWNVQAHTGDPNVIPIFRFFANLRMNLLPHIWSEAIKASRSGLPLMRALPLEFPYDPQAAEFPYQYLFGENLLVASVVWEGCREMEVYLPSGEWYDFWTGACHVGPCRLQCDVPWSRIPVFVRAGTLVAFHLDESLRLGSAVGNGVEGYQQLVLRTYPAHQISSYTWFERPDRPPVVVQILPHDPFLR